jgi:hypothetical protein
VTQPAKIGDVEFLGDNRTGIGGMLGLRTVAGFARDARMLSFATRFSLGVVTDEAVALASVVDGQRANCVEGSGSVVSIFSEGLGNNGAANDQEDPIPASRTKGGRSKCPASERCSSSSLPVSPFQKRTSNRHLNASDVKHMQDEGQKIALHKGGARQKSLFRCPRVGCNDPNDWCNDATSPFGHQCAPMSNEA